MTVSSFSDAIDAIADAITGSGGTDPGQWIKNSLGVLILRLADSDIIKKNKVKSGKSSDIRLTSSAEEGRELGKTGFFPSLTPETPFEGRRIRVDVLVSTDNVRRLAAAKGKDASQILEENEDEWVQSHLQIRRKSDINDSANPVVMLGYSDDIRPLREFLYEGDYLIFLKDPKGSKYRAVGLKSDWVDARFPTGNGAKLALFSAAAERDPSVFYLGDLLASGDCRQTELNFHASSLSLPKPFVLLAGISGTGKSRFVSEQARLCRPDVSTMNYCLIPVRPDWHEPADLLGYKSRIDGEKYVATDFLRFVVAAWLDATDEEGELREPQDMITHWACLDEMNLAPVEQYFADFLSVLETRHFESGAYRCEPLLRGSEIRSLKEEARDDLKRQLFDDGVDSARRDKLFEKFANNPVWDGIPIPPNLVVAGTVNMDETTHGFSRKVIDRALTLDFQEFYPNEFGRYLDDTPTKIRALTFPFAFDSREASVKAALKATADTDGKRTVAFLDKLNSSLRESPFELAYRALNEALLSVACFARLPNSGDASDGESQDNDASNPEAVDESPEATGEGGTTLDELALMATWDDFLMQKVLPRIEGDGAKLKALRTIEEETISLPAEFGRDTILHQLYSLLAAQLKPIWGDEPDDTYEPTAASPTRPDLLRHTVEHRAIPCRSRKKLRWMMRRLKANHFTDFWC